MHQNIQLIGIKVDRSIICEHIGGPSPTICGLFLLYYTLLLLSLVLLSSSERLTAVIAAAVLVLDAEIRKDLESLLREPSRYVPVLCVSAVRQGRVYS